MNKQAFLAELKARLSGLSQDDIEERLAFYTEMIDDRMEEGLSEEDAVSGIGAVDEIVSQIVAEVPLTKIVKEKVKPKRALKGWEGVLLAFVSPFMAVLILAGFAVILSAYAVVWAVIVSLWAIEVSFAACALMGVISSVVFWIHGNVLTGIAMLGVGIFCSGLAIFMLFGCKQATQSILSLTKKTALGIKSMFIGKEGAK